MRIKTVLKKTAGLVLLMTMFPMLFGCNSVSAKKADRDVADYVAKTIPEPTHQVDVIVQKGAMGKNEYHYTFSSNQRDLTFDVYYKPDDNFGKYRFENFYGMATRKYYEDALTKEIALYPNSDLNQSGTFNTIVYVSTQDDAKALAEMLSNCNRIVSDQWNYTPGADLTDKKIMGIHFYFYPVGGNKEDTSSGLGSYTLNGSDDADTIYKEISKLLQ